MPSPLPQPVQGKSDWRSYRPLLLNNNIQALLVHDDKAVLTACSVCVNDAGASNDPRSLSGLAHFVEHMVFYGSKKYPVENYYKRYLATHGGRSNASTSMDCATFKFEVMQEHAEEAVDIFAQFFVDPLMTESGTGREVQAVNSENSKNMATDARRRLQILKALADQDHHFSKFSTGNKETLPTTNDEETRQLREALLAFHKRHYRPKNMSVVIVGPQPVDTLQEWIVPRFESIPDRYEFLKNGAGEFSDIEQLIADSAKDAPKANSGVFHPAFRPGVQGGKWPVQLTTRPLNASRLLTLYFPVPPVDSAEIRDHCPVSFLGHLFGHEGKGSPFAAMQDAGLVTGLSTGAKVSAHDQTLMQINISLTPKGEERWKDVVSVLFAHIRIVQETIDAAAAGHVASSDDNNGEKNAALLDLERIYDEILHLKRTDFDMSLPGSPFGTAPPLSRSLLQYGSEKCISIGSSLDETKETLPLELLKDFASRLTPSNFFIERCSQVAWDEAMERENKLLEANSDARADDDIFGVQKEKWYGVEYHLDSVDDGDVAIWEGNAAVEDEEVQQMLSKLDLPAPNIYIPENMELCDELPEEAKQGPRIEKPIDAPKLVIQNDHGRLWHRLDDRYALPKASLSLLLKCRPTEHSLNEDGVWQFDPDAVNTMNLLMQCFYDAKAQDTYDADLAGLAWDVKSTTQGIVVSCGGYSDKIPILASKILTDFVENSDQYLSEQYFQSAKDRTMRKLKSYLSSTRSDDLAKYYTHFLTRMRSEGVDESIACTEKASLSTLKNQHARLFSDRIQMECLYTGNVSEEVAKKFFLHATDVVQSRLSANSNGADLNGNGKNKKWYPGGAIERRLNPGEDIHMHFPSENSEEQNGAVVMKFQSTTPGFKAGKLSSEKAIKQSAAIRLICGMLREPFFNELRTKQQLGYIVSSSYEMSVSNSEDSLMADDHALDFAVIDGITMKVLSQKVPPDEICERVDEFLLKFGEMLEAMPESEIKIHSDSLSKKMLKPIKSLYAEAGVHFAKIKRYAPEVIDSGGSPDDIPWDSINDLAAAVRSIERKDLVEAWETLVINKDKRARLVSHVYGSKFPKPKVVKPSKNYENVVQMNSLRDLIEKRRELQVYDNNISTRPMSFWRSSLRKLYKPVSPGLKMTMAVGVGALSVGVLVKTFLENRGGKKSGKD
eukprot:CAMPEP_0116007748 /NCGR_PEP_ID=MMETSP0321-20121206/2472_1 /TAXON_ID=163516 /ORGANISM="Leptocylindrus danicus var. danicus, Strain B650" /LENGTH=1177 /DNA_ID=CAMNT_0003476479 /DNA_START=185 /DNA_END=3718 /DNA_ORIENTATION=+